MEERRTIVLNNGVEIDRIGLGFWELRGQEASDVLLEAAKAGYRRIDTAMYYGNEEAVGAGIRNCGVPREELFVASKLWHTDMCGGKQEEAFLRSLEQLGLEYLDLYYLHWPIGEVTESWRVLERLYEAGKIRAIGVCNFQPVHLQGLLAKANVCPAVNQIESNPCFQQNAAVEFCQREGITVEAWGPLGKGRDLSQPLLAELAAKYERTPAQLVLRWHLQRGMTAVPKSAHPERLRQNREVFDFVLEQKDMDAFRALDTGKSRRGYPPEFRFDSMCECAHEV